jgi:GDP-mannose 6-dehydrogenase
MAAIALFGLGHVGTVSAACLARDGHRVTAVDVDPQRTEALNRGISPVVEKGLAELVAKAVAAGTLTATLDAAEAVAASDISLVCVGTPASADGSIDLSSVRRACAEIGGAVRDDPGHHVVAIRSTMVPGSLVSVVVPTLEAASGKRAGRDFGVCVNPEFQREGNAVQDYDHPAKIVIGDLDSRAGDRIAELYCGIEAPLFRVSAEMAELTKYIDNSWHALKVAFANEIGQICAAVGVDPLDAMKIFVSDSKLNISAAYLMPGFAFGGPCLPKDLRALTRQAGERRLAVPLLEAVAASNAHRIDAAVARVLSTGKRRIGILGFAFKPGTDDIRESPFLVLAAALADAGCTLRLYDRNIGRGTVAGQNRDFALSQLPRFEDMLAADAAELIDFAEVIVLGSHPDNLAARPGQTIIDLGRAALGWGG